MTHDAGYAALVGIDWADTKHDCCLRALGADQEEYGVIGHLPEAIDHWARALAARFLGGKIAVCLEQSKGSLIYALLKYDHLVLYPINPRMLAKFREAFAPSGKKDDPTDVQLLLELVSKHREKLKPWRPADEHTRTLQFLVEHRRILVNDKTRLTNRLTNVLTGDFPQVLCWFAALDTLLVCDFLKRWPTLMDRGAMTAVDRKRPGAARPSRLPITLADLITTIQDVVGPEEDELVVATVRHLLRSGRPRQRQETVSSHMGITPIDRPW